MAHLIAAHTDPPDTTLIVAALLHDTVEDTKVTLTDLEQSFGADVAALVAEVTDDKSLPKEMRKALQVQTRLRRRSGRKSSSWPTRFPI